MGATDVEIAYWRMRNLRLSGHPFETPEEVVHWLGAVQSQDYGPAKWSVAQRTRGIHDAAMDRAFAAGTILRTHILRPTWHFVLPADIRWMLQLTAPRVHAFNAYYHRQQGVDDAALKKCNELLVGILQGGNQLTRKELMAEIESAGISASSLRLALILMHAELSGIICSGALKDKQHTYALLDERAPQARSLTRDEALAELTLRYFTGHGPATAKDFKWWSSLTMADIRKGLEIVGSQLEHEVRGGSTYWFAPSARRTASFSPRVHLLQAYDEYIVGYSESKYVLEATGAAGSLPRVRGVFNGVVLLNSQMVGHWKRMLKKNSLIIEAALYAPFDETQTGLLEAEAHRHGEFLGLSATVVSTVM